MVKFKLKVGSSLFGEKFFYELSKKIQSPNHDYSRDFNVDVSFPIKFEVEAIVWNKNRIESSSQ